MVEAKSAEIDSATLWDRYRNELMTFLGRGKPSSMKTIQLLPQAVPAEWDSDESIFQHFCLNAPKWGSVWEFQSGRVNFFEQYSRFLYSLHRDSNDNNAAKYRRQLDDLYEKEFDLLDSLEREEIACEEKYNTYNKALSVSFNQFKNTHCFEVLDLEADLKHLKARLVVLGRRAYGGQKQFAAGRAVAHMVENRVNEKKFIELTPLTDFIEANKKGQFNSFKLDIDENTSSSSQKSSFKSFGFSIGIPSFFSIGVGSSKSKFKMNTSEQKFKMSIGAKSWTAIKVIPDPRWFSGEVLREWANGPFNDPKITKNTFFAKNEKSTLPLMPKTIYVVYKPSVELTLSKDDAERLESKKSFGLKLSIGPLSFNYDKKTSTQKSEQKDGLYRFIIESKSDTPQVIAVDNVELPF
eukprot:CAMPEP_0117425430 /NCGR_PEP_ID=MMETSP0758-20121206/5686_1 /TAXON_ID=63605 /ORGANISM="Percolomonas cosmopolitus, Strain AE-1 (ATCC 50343)" /LENGTH=408 /DNA_ID=CAMNT_0005209875 /DNA_START=44 /DNA_END=1270 /DNA_ORIENTATION=+